MATETITKPTTPITSTFELSNCLCEFLRSYDGFRISVTDIADLIDFLGPCKIGKTWEELTTKNDRLDLLKSPIYFNPEIAKLDSKLSSGTELTNDSYDQLAEEVKESVDELYEIIKDKQKIFYKVAYDLDLNAMIFMKTPTIPNFKSALEPLVPSMNAAKDIADILYKLALKSSEPVFKDRAERFVLRAKAAQQATPKFYDEVNRILPNYDGELELLSDTYQSIAHCLYLSPRIIINSLNDLFEHPNVTKVFKGYEFKGEPENLILTSSRRSPEEEEEEDEDEEEDD